MHTFDEVLTKQDLTGRRVLYMLNQGDVDSLAQQRKVVYESAQARAPKKAAEGEHQITLEQADRALAYAIRSGNAVMEGTVYPGVIVSPWHGPYCNIQVFLDGTDSYWATSRSEFHPEGPADPNVLYGSGRWHFHAEDGEVEMSDINALLIAYQDEHGRDSKLTDVLEAAGITWSWEPDARGTWIFADTPA